MSLKKFSMILAAVSGVSVLSGFIPVIAQDGVSGRIDRLERAIDSLEANVYGGKSKVVRSSASDQSGNSYNMFDDRISALENEIRNLTEQIERANHQSSLLETKLDRMQSDHEFRFRQLEGKPPSGNNAALTGAEGAGDKSNGSFGASAGSLAHSPGSSAAPQGKTPKEQYDAAYTLLRNNDYAAATSAFQNFIAQNPQDQLAGSATYWLGQLFYVNEKYEQAAVTYMDVFRKYPKSPKVGDGLLGVSRAMDKLGRKKESCAALSHLLKDVPGISDDVKKQAMAEKRKQAC